MAHEFPEDIYIEVIVVDESNNCKILEKGTGVMNDDIFSCGDFSPMNYPREGANYIIIAKIKGDRSGHSYIMRTTCIADNKSVCAFKYSM